MRLYERGKHWRVLLYRSDRWNPWPLINVDFWKCKYVSWTLGYERVSVVLGLRSETSDPNQSRTHILIILTPRPLLLCVGICKHIHLKCIYGREQDIYTIALCTNIVFVFGITQIFRCKILKFYETLPDLNVCKSHLISFVFHTRLKL